MSDRDYIKQEQEYKEWAHRTFDEIKDEAVDGMLTYEKIKKIQGNRWDDLTRSHYLRRLYVSNISWAVFTKEWLDCLAKKLEGKRVLEVCSGTGVLAKNMRERGIDWVATDIGESGGYDINRSKIFYINDTVFLDAVIAAKIFEVDAVFASWIPLHSTVDLEVADICQKKRIPFIIVGEGHWGCTGSKDFWEKYGARIKGVCWDANFFHWDGLHDSTYMLPPPPKQKKKKKSSSSS